MTATSPALAAPDLPRTGRAAAVRSTARGVGPAVIGLVAFFLGWELVIRATNTPSFVVPAPSAIAQRLWVQLPEYSNEFLYTLAAAGAGLAIGTTVGVTGAIIM